MNLPLVLLWFAEPGSIIKTSFNYLHLTRASVVTTPDSLQCKTININTLWYWVGIFAALKWSTYCWVALGGIVITFKSLCHSVPPVWFLHNNLRDLLFVGGEFYFYLERIVFQILTNWLIFWSHVYPFLLTFRTGDTSALFTTGLKYIQKNVFLKYFKIF